MVCWHHMERALCSMISEIEPRRWRSGSFIGALHLGRRPGVAPGWYGPGLWPWSLLAAARLRAGSMDHNARTRQKLVALVGKERGTICGLLVSVTDKTSVQLVWLRELICWSTYALPIPWRMLSIKLVPPRLSDNDGTRSECGGSSLKSGTPLPFESMGSSMERSQVRSSASNVALS